MVMNVRFATWLVQVPLNSLILVYFLVLACDCGLFSYSDDLGSCGVLSAYKALLACLFSSEGS